MSKKAWISFSGLLWIVVGCLLLYKGLRILCDGVDTQRADRASWLIAIGLFVGFIKGRFALAKTVRRLVLRIESLDMPIRMQDVYPKSYWILLSSMMAIGFLLRYIPLEWRGCIDVAVGSALIHGAMLYFRAARAFPAKY